MQEDVARIAQQTLPAVRGRRGWICLDAQPRSPACPASNNRIAQPFLKQLKWETSKSIQAFFNLGTAEDSSPFGGHVKDAEGNVHVWQAKSYAFNIHSPEKAIQKLEYMHNNPVRAGFVSDPCAWPWSSAAHFLLGKPSLVKLVPMDGPITFVSPRKKPRGI